ENGNTVLNTELLWPNPVPYVLEDSLDLEAKGVILQAFEHFRLKSCIDFKPRQSEEDYISVRRNPGCYSFVSRIIKSGQVLSIGENCVSLGTVEHEFLHALGFHHEQSRYDRDDYVTINWRNIKDGLQNNFKKLSRNSSITFSAPYDYLSVMHYGKDFFSKNSGDTIITKLPQFQDRIGQRMEMSPLDVFKLNLLYRCIKLHSYFMHASTASGQEGDSAWLETKKMIPTRDCHVQCLQFYYYHSGGQSDQLNIWIREFQDETDTKGINVCTTCSVCLRQFSSPGRPMFAWQFHKVPLNASKPFQVVFEVRKGGRDSSGGFSIDDINLSESECPHSVWQINDFETVLTNNDFDSYVFSPRMYSTEGYAYQVILRLRETFFGVLFRLVSGEYDSTLEWPCPWRQVTISMLDQNPQIQRQMSKQITLTTDPSSSGFDDPRTVGELTRTNGESFYANSIYGIGSFLSLEEMKNQDFLKGGNAVFLISITGELKHP
uniref:Metalloendopeptidase n=1 Tax=Mastacembelus armatus TaxID=205130 RepID=A0A3Q3L755_9TELE